jgi:hypothetical protein
MKGIYMTQTITERLGQGAVDALHQAIQIAWQAGYDQAVSDMNSDKDLGGGRTLRLAVVSNIEMDDRE